MMDQFPISEIKIPRSVHFGRQNYSRFGVLVEAALFRVAFDVPALRQLLFVHRILSTSISFDQTHDHQEQEEQCNCAHHPNEPRSVCNIILRVAVDCCKDRNIVLSIFTYMKILHRAHDDVSI